MISSVAAWRSDKRKCLTGYGGNNGRQGCRKSGLHHRGDSQSCFQRLIPCDTIKASVNHRSLDLTQNSVYRNSLFTAEASLPSTCPDCKRSLYGVAMTLMLFLEHVNGSTSFSFSSRPSPKLTVYIRTLPVQAGGYLNQGCCLAHLVLHSHRNSVPL